jgi:hypothetical protein
MANDNNSEYRLTYTLVEGMKPDGIEGSTRDEGSVLVPVGAKRVYARNEFGDPGFGENDGGKTAKETRDLALTVAARQLYRGPYRAPEAFVEVIIRKGNSRE